MVWVSSGNSPNARNREQWERSANASKEFREQWEHRSQRSHTTLTANPTHSSHPQPAPCVYSVICHPYTYSFIPEIYIALLQETYSEALPATAKERGLQAVGRKQANCTCHTYISTDSYLQRASFIEDTFPLLLKTHFPFYFPSKPHNPHPQIAPCLCSLLLLMCLGAVHLVRTHGGGRG